MAIGEGVNSIFGNITGVVESLRSIFFRVVLGMFKMLLNLPDIVKIVIGVIIVVFFILVIYIAWKNRDSWRNVYYY